NTRSRPSASYKPESSSGPSSVPTPTADPRCRTFNDAKRGREAELKDRTRTEERLMLQEREILFHRVPRDELPDYFHEAYDVSEGHGDAVQWEVLANSPIGARWFADSYAALFFSGTVDRRLKLLVRCRLARSNGCAMCSTAGIEEMLAEGFTPDAIDAVTAWPEPFVPEPFSPIEIAVLKYADQMVLANLDGALDAELYTELRQFFDDGQLVELGLLMSFFSC